MLYGRTGRDRFREPNLDGSYKRTTTFLGAGVEKKPASEKDNVDDEFKPQPSLRAKWLNKKSSTEKLKMHFQAQEAEEDLHAFQRQKTKLREENIKEKRKDLEDLKSYKPWGKPAGGAPQVTLSGKVQARRQGIQFDTPPSSRGEIYNPFGRPGGGAPRVNEDGLVAPAMTKNPELFFSDKLKNEVEITMRYGIANADAVMKQKPPNTSKWEVTSNFTSLANRTNSEKEKLENEKNKKLRYAEALEQQKKEELDKKKSKDDIDEKFIWGKNSVSRDKSGKLLPRRRLLGEPAGVAVERAVTGQHQYLSMADKMGGAESKRRNDKSDDKTELPWERKEPPLHVKTHHLTDRKPSEHVQVEADKEESGRGEGLDAATWMRTGAVGMPKTLVDPATGHVLGGKRKITDLTFQASRKSSGHHQVQVDKDKASRGAGLDMATWMRTGAVGMPKRTIDPATGHVEGVSRQATDLTVLANGKKPIIGTHNDGKPISMQYSTDLQKQSEERQRAKEAEKNQRIEEEMLHVHNAGHMWGKKGQAERRGFTSMDWSGWADDKDTVNAKKTLYRKELEQLTEEKTMEQKKEREKKHSDERKHIEKSDQDWGRPGGGAPRRDPNGKVETSRNRTDSLKFAAAIHTGWDFRRT